MARSFDVPAKEIKRKGSRANRARHVAVYLTKRYSGLGNREIGVHFGGLHESAVSKVAARLESTFRTDHALSRRISKLESGVKT